MNENNNFNELIEAYQEGTLSPTEKVHFEQQLKSNQAFADKWQLHQEIDKTLSNSNAFEMEDLLENIGNEFVEKYKSTQSESPQIQSTKPRIRTMYRWAIAASVALLLGFFGWQFGQETSQNPAELYASFYEPYPTSLTTRSEVSALESDFQKGQKSYLGKDYKTAIVQFSTILKQENLATETITEAHFYKGLAHLGNEEFDLAQKELSSALTPSKHAYTQQAQWYLALISLKKGEIKTAKNWCKQVINTAEKGKYAKKAKELLQNLGD